MKENTAAIHCQVPVDVVAFLLNEKRAEVIKIESRFKVHVLMIPNKHLETPHYKLERLRHDDPRLDEQKLSYVMVEESTRELETDTVIGRKNEEVRARPEAAVKGITPSQPAPMASARPARESASAKTGEASSGGIFGFFKRYSLLLPPPNPKRSNLMLVQKVEDVTAIAIIVIAVAIVKTELRVAIIRIAQKKLQILVSQTRIAHVRQVGDVTAVSAINSKNVTIKHPPTN